jgi:hypothetical protein
MAVINTGIVERTIVGVNESDLFLDSEATSVTTNTGIVERSIVGVHDANFVHPLGDEEITNGDFSNGSTDWTLGTGWSIGENKAIHNGAQSLIGQTNILTIGKSYKITFDLSGADSSNYARLLSSQYPNGGNYTSDGTITVYTTTNIDDLYIYGVGNISITNISVKEMLVNRESTTTNTGIVERPITGVNDGGDLFLDESTSVVNNTGIVERPITGVNESDALFPDNTESTVVNISDTIIPLLTALEARATTFENREGTQNILINLEKC